MSLATAPVSGEGARIRQLTGKRTDRHRHIELLQKLQDGGIEIRHRHGLQIERGGHTATAASDQLVLKKVEFQIDGFAAARDQRCAEAPRRHIERHLPTVIEPGRETEPDFAHHLHPELKGQRGVAPFGKDKPGPQI